MTAPTATFAADTFDSPAAYAAALAEFLRNDPRAEPYIGYRAAEPRAQPPPTSPACRRCSSTTGWSRLGWPESAGGLGGDPRFRAAMFQTLWDLDIQIPEPFTHARDPRARAARVRPTPRRRVAARSAAR